MNSNIEKPQPSNPDISALDLLHKGKKFLDGLDLDPAVRKVVELKNELDESKKQINDLHLEREKLIEQVKNLYRKRDENRELAIQYASELQHALDEKDTTESSSGTPLWPWIVLALGAMFCATVLAALWMVNQ